MVRDLIKKGLRLDERKLLQYRPIQIKFDVSKNAEGSCEVSIGETKVIAGVKLSIGKPFEDTPDEGILVVNSEFYPIAHRDFEPGPPSEKAIELARVVDRGLRESEALDMKKLCIKEGEACWMVFVDIYVVNHDGNLIDAALLASLLALKKAKFPKLVEENEEYKVDYKEHEGNLPLQHFPIAVTVNKIDDKLFVDANLKEESEIDCGIVVISDEDKNVVGLQKLGDDGFSEEELFKALEIGIKKGEEIRKTFKAFLK